jgi:hypothetical protein
MIALRPIGAAVLAMVAGPAGLVSACAQAPPTPQPSRSAVAHARPRPVLGEWAGQVADVAWAGDARVAVVTRSGDVLRVDLSADGPPRRMDPITGGASEVAADPASGVIVAWNSLSGETAAWSADGARIGSYRLGFAGVGDLALRAGGDRFAVVGATVSVVDVATGDVVSRGERPAAPDAVEYSSVAYSGDSVLAWPGADLTLDVWNVAAPAAVLTAQDCGCDYHRHALGPAAGPSAFATQVGALVLWDPAGNRAVARRMMVTSPDEGVDPLAVVRDRYVLYVLVRDIGDGATASGSLMLWDARTDAVSEAWDARTGVASAAGDGRTGVAGAPRPCADCMVRGVWPRPDSAEILIEVAAGNGDDQTFWTATLAP